MSDLCRKVDTHRRGRHLFRPCFHPSGPRGLPQCHQRLLGASFGTRHSPSQADSRARRWVLSRSWVGNGPESTAWCLTPWTPTLSRVRLVNHQLLVFLLIMPISLRVQWRHIWLLVRGHDGKVELNLMGNSVKRFWRSGSEVYNSKCCLFIAFHFAFNFTSMTTENILHACFVVQTEIYANFDPRFVVLTDGGKDQHLQGTVRVWQRCMIRY